MAETLHISTFPKSMSLQQSQKTPLVLIHGWGLNSAVWQPFIESLSDEFTSDFYIITVDLPGFGINVDKELSTYTLANVCQCIANSITQPAVYLGWSLGGLVATEMALSYPAKVLALITVASSPCFLEEEIEHEGIAQTVWPGIKAKILDAFHQAKKSGGRPSVRIEKASNPKSRGAGGGRVANDWPRAGHLP